MTIDDDWVSAREAAMRAPSTRIWAATEAPGTIDDTLVTLVLDALGCASEPATRAPKPALLPASAFVPDGSSADREVTARWWIETPSCTIGAQQTEGLFPGDVNQPSHYWKYVEVIGWRHDRATIVRTWASVGSKEMSVCVVASSAKRQEIVAKLQAAFEG